MHQRSLLEEFDTDMFITRYEIAGDAPAWQEAEKQVQSGRGNTVVSIKSGKQKRKEGPTAADVYEEVLGDKSSRKKVKKSKKGQ